MDRLQQIKDRIAPNLHMDFPLTVFDLSCGCCCGIKDKNGNNVIYLSNEEAACQPEYANFFANAHTDILWLIEKLEQ